MKKKSLVRRMARRAETLFLAAAMLMTTVTIPAKAQDNAEDVVVNFVEEGTKKEGLVVKNPDADDYITDNPFVNNEVGDKDVINNAFDGESTLTYEVGITVDEYTCSSGSKTPQVVAYAMDFEDGTSWKQAQYSISQEGESCDLSLSLKNYSRLDLLGVRVINCDEGTTVKYTINYARVVKKAAATTPNGVIATLVDAGTKKTGKVEVNAYAGTNPNSHNILNERFDIPSELKKDLSSYGELSLQVGVTIDNYTATEAGTTDDDAAVILIYAMNDTYGDWKQQQAIITEKGQKFNLELDLSEYQYLGEFGLRFGGCDLDSTIEYTIDYARVAGAVQSSDIATLVDAGTKKTGKVEENAYAGTNPNSHNIMNERFDIPWNLKTNLNAFKELKLQVSITINDYTATEAGTTEDDAAVVMIYSMNDQYGDWRQHQEIITEKGQTVELELDLLGYEYLGEFGLRFGGCDLGSNVVYTINYAKVVGDDGGSSVTEEEIELKYEITGATKELAFKDTPVGQHGKLSVKQVPGYSAPTIVDKNGEPYQLRGASTHGLAWFPKYVNKGAFQSLRDEWGMNLIRIAVYAREGGYTTGEEEAARDDALIQQGVQAAKELGMYVIIDWHVLNYNPNEDKEAAKAFFKKYVEMYGEDDNVLFEICNEPTGTPWYDGSDNDLYTYCKELTGLIRDAGSDAIVLCGTNQFSSEIDKVAEKPLSQDGFTNVMYNCHFYAASHREEAQQKLLDALKDGTPVFISEYGICTASGDGRYDVENANKWLGICDENNVSYACWAMSNSEESAAYFKTDCEKTEGGWIAEDLTNTARYLINYYRARQESLEACAHKEKETRGYKAATEKEEGYTGDIYCKKCNTLLEKGKVIPKTVKIEQNVQKTLPKSGTTVSVGADSYTILTEGAEVAFEKTTSKAKKITVPDTVVIEGVTYKVTAIADNAFANNKKVSQVKIGKNVSKIGKAAFKKCTALKKITIPANVTEIRASAFEGCKKLKTITITSKKLKSVGKNAFKGINAKAKIKVPSQKLKAYKNILKKKGQGKKVKIVKK